MKRRGITYIYTNYEDLIIVAKILRYLTVIAHYYYILLVSIDWPQNVTKLFQKRFPYRQPGAVEGKKRWTSQAKQKLTLWG